MNALFDFGGAFVREVGGRLAGGFGCMLSAGEDFRGAVVLLPGAKQLPARIYRGSAARLLIFAVLREYLLLTAEQLGNADLLGGGFGVVRELVGVLLLLVGDLPTARR